MSDLEPVVESLISAFKKKDGIKSFPLNWKLQRDVGKRMFWDQNRGAFVETFKL